MTHQLFTQLALKKTLLSSLKNLSFTDMTEIQRKSLKDILQGKDIIAQAKTGSGKTLAFSLGVLNKLNSKNTKVQSLILCPTRELAQQVASEIRRLAQSIENTKVLELCGGTPFTPQRISLEFGAHCIVGTPGRVLDHLERRTLRCDSLETLVFDEADRMLDMGFSDTLEKILKHIPQKRQTLFFSATYPENIKALSCKVQNQAIFIKVESDNEPKNIHEIFYRINFSKKHEALTYILNHYTPRSCLIFCNTKQGTKDLQIFLEKAKYSCLAIHGDLEQKERDEILVHFKNQSCHILIATDVAARGIHVDDLDLVINFDLSKDPKNHIHRIGRTGRAGKKGRAISLFTNKEIFKKQNIEKEQGTIFSEENIEELTSFKKPYPKSKMVTFRIANGKKNKLRPTDILGALTASPEIKAQDVGKINIFNFHSFVAIENSKENIAKNVLSNHPIKGKILPVKKSFPIT